jgi:hypothetical protein
LFRESWSLGWWRDADAQLRQFPPVPPGFGAVHAEIASDPAPFARRNSMDSSPSRHLPALRTAHSRAHKKFTDGVAGET